MAKAKRTVKDTGIYRSETIPFGPDGDDESMKEAVAAINAAMADRPKTLDEWLAHYEAVGKSVLAHHAGEPIADDAKSMLEWLGILQTNLQRGEVRPAVYHAIQVGRLVERLGVRPFERYVKPGKNSQSGAAKAREKGQVKTDALYDEINSAVADRLRKRGRHRTPSLTQIRHDVATDSDVSYDTVLRAAKCKVKK